MSHQIITTIAAELASPLDWHHYASMDEDELKHFGTRTGGTTSRSHCNHYDQYLCCNLFSGQHQRFSGH
ncbi:hypothetical protein PAXRUDRAFT_835360 [Paxillus rubicundulus Ve08.2h10]|uniref:Unplaced genomic scaffold scaffold_2667, whole genome shotgun sequence n=1 Tax=Paxillus rubicundulus Ve08.2h10 TaxID=930991 RepID=A0A0D0BZH6_9AGAM|nr:hypothetical protein PAXRUDRAFT_835360 [Paxillus rubicundulus Ve08.2h10]